MKVLAEEGTNQMIEEIKKLKGTSGSKYMMCIEFCNWLQESKEFLEKYINGDFTYEGNVKEFFVITAGLSIITYSILNGSFLFDYTDQDGAYDPDEETSTNINSAIVDYAKEYYDNCHHYLNWLNPNNPVKYENQKLQIKFLNALLNHMIYSYIHGTVPSMSWDSLFDYLPNVLFTQSWNTTRYQSPTN